MSEKFLQSSSLGCLLLPDSKEFDKIVDSSFTHLTWIFSSFDARKCLWIKKVWSVVDFQQRLSSITSWMSFFFLSWISRTFDSTVFSDIIWYTWTGLVWPMRFTLSIAWLSIPSCHQLLLQISGWKKTRCKNASYGSILMKSLVSVRRYRRSWRFLQIYIVRHCWKSIRIRTQEEKEWHIYL